MSNSKHVTLALMEGELSAITVEFPDGGEELRLFAADVEMVERAVEALRRSYPGSVIRVTRPGGSVMHVMQTGPQIDVLRKRHSPPD